MSSNTAECWLHRVHLPPKASMPQEWRGDLAQSSDDFLKESAVRKYRLERLLQNAASGQPLTTKSSSSSRYGDFGGLQQPSAGMPLTLSKSGIIWEADGNSSLLIPLLLADVMFSPVVKPKLTFPFARTPDATHVILIAPRVPGKSAVWLLCTNTGDDDVSLDHLIISFSRRGAVRWDIRQCHHFSASCCGQGGHGTIFGGVSLLPLYDEHRKLIQSQGDVLHMAKVHNFGRVAVKIWDKMDSAMVRREVDFLQQSAGHPNISAMLGVFAEAQKKKSSVVWLLVMEHCTGGDLFELIKANYLSLGRILDIQVSLASALVHLHHLRIVHRDVKAENVVLQKERAVLIDFGIAAYLDDEEAMCRPVGSPGYAAPEIIAHEPRRYDERVDIFALGVVSHFMTFRTLPFWAETHEEMLEKTRRCEVEIPEYDDSEFNPTISLMLQMMSKESTDRPSAMACFHELTKFEKESRAIRIARAALVRYGYVEPPGDNSLAEFSDDNGNGNGNGSGDVSCSASRAPSVNITSPQATLRATPAPTINSIKSRNSIMSGVGSMLSSARRRVLSLRVPKVGPTVSKVLRNVAHLSEASPSTAVIPAPHTNDAKQASSSKDAPPAKKDSAQNAAEEMIPGRVSSHYSDLGNDARGASKDAKGQHGPPDPSVASTTLGVSTLGVASDPVGSAGNQKSSTLDSGHPSHSSTLEHQKLKHGIASASKAPHVFSLDDSSEGPVSSRILPKLDDPHFAVHEEPDDLEAEEEYPKEPDAYEQDEDELPEDPAGDDDRLQEEILPQILLISAVAPSSQPPLQPTPPPGERPKGLPKHRQRGLGMFKKLASQQADEPVDRSEPDDFAYAPVASDELE